MGGVPYMGVPHLDGYGKSENRMNDLGVPPF